MVLLFRFFETDLLIYYLPVMGHPYATSDYKEFNMHKHLFYDKKIEKQIRYWRSEVLFYFLLPDLRFQIQM
jgi:hypothetical protein